MKRSEQILNATTIVAALCAVLVTVGMFRRGDFGSPSRSTEPVRAPRVIPDFEAILAGGHRIGPLGARLTIVEFGDFECPGCAAFARVIDSLRRRYPNDIALVYRHMPLPYHRTAYPLARASECAAAQGKFEAFYYHVFLESPDLGLDGGTRLAKSLRVADSGKFLACARDTARVAAIDHDLSLAKRLELPGTPAIIIAGVLYPGILSSKDLEAKILRP